MSPFADFPSCRRSLTLGTGVNDEKWRNAANAYPLSLSMPLTLGEHGNSKTEPFLWGLLPDNEKVLDQWGKKFQVSSRNAFGLIAGVGEEVAAKPIHAALYRVTWTIEIEACTESVHATLSERAIP